MTQVIAGARAVWTQPAARRSRTWSTSTALLIHCSVCNALMISRGRVLSVIPRPRRRWPPRMICEKNQLDAFRHLPEMARGRGTVQCHCHDHDFMTATTPRITRSKMEAGRGRALAGVSGEVTCRLVCEERSCRLQPLHTTLAASVWCLFACQPKTKTRFKPNFKDPLFL